MAETTADVRRDIEMTRDRISETLQQLEQKTNVMQMVKDHPWPALAVAMGAGVLLSGSGSDVKAAAATATATRGASSKLGTLLDDLVANLVTGLNDAFQYRVEGLVNEVKTAIGAPVTPGAGRAPARPASGRSQHDLTGHAMTEGSGGLAGAGTAGTPGSGGYGTASGDSGRSFGASAGTAGSSGSWAPQSARTEQMGSPGIGATVNTGSPSPGFPVERAD